MNDKKQIFGWAMYDWANSAYITTVTVAVLPIFFEGTVVPPEGILIAGTRYSAAWEPVEYGDLFHEREEPRSPIVLACIEIVHFRSFPHEAIPRHAPVAATADAGIASRQKV